MNAIFCKRLPTYLLATVFGLWQLPANAIPKAAEDEDAQVTTGIDVARPKATPKPVKKEAGKKASSSAKGKPHGKTATSKKTKATSVKN